MVFSGRQDEWGGVSQQLNHYSWQQQKIHLFSRNGKRPAEAPQMVLMLVTKHLRNFKKPKDMIFTNHQARSSGTMTNGAEDLRGILNVKEKCVIWKSSTRKIIWDHGGLKDDMGQNYFQ